MRTPVLEIWSFLLQFGVIHVDFEKLKKMNTGQEKGGETHTIRVRKAMWTLMLDKSKVTAGVLSCIKDVIMINPLWVCMHAAALTLYC